MTHRAEPTAPAESYAEQLRRWVHALAASRDEDVADALAEGSSPSQVRLFTEGNAAKRHAKLLQSLEFLAGTFDDFEGLVSAYVGAVPAPAYYTSADGERFLSWLEGAAAPTARQRDYIACVRGRLAVEAAARADRAGHLRFQELRDSAARRAADLDSRSVWRVYLNPSRAWSRFTTPALLDDSATLPADVLFFAAGDTIRTAVLEARGRALVEALVRCGPPTLGEWATLTGETDCKELVALCRDLAEMGLVAFE